MKKWNLLAVVFVVLALLTAGPASAQTDDPADDSIPVMHRSELEKYQTRLIDRMIRLEAVYKQMNVSDYAVRGDLDRRFNMLKDSLPKIGGAKYSQDAWSLLVESTTNLDKLDLKMLEVWLADYNNGLSNKVKDRMKTRAADLKSKTAYIVGAQGTIESYRNRIGKLRNDIRGKGGPAKGEAKRALAGMAKEVRTADRMLLDIRVSDVNDYEPKKTALDKALTDLAETHRQVKKATAKALKGI